MWIDVVCGLLPAGHVYLHVDKHNWIMKRTSAVGTRCLLHLG
jgi:hypothetical protein